MKAKGRDRNRRGEVLVAEGGRVHVFKTGAWYLFVLLENSPEGEKAVKSTKMVTEAGLGQERYRQLFFPMVQFFFFLMRGMKLYLK